MNRRSKFYAELANELYDDYDDDYDDYDDNYASNDGCDDYKYVKEGSKAKNNNTTTVSDKNNKCANRSEANNDVNEGVDNKK